MTFGAVKLINKIALRFQHLRRGISSKVTRQDNEVLKVDVLSGRDKGIIVLGLDRPEAKNALNRELAYSMDDTLEAIKFDKSVRAVVIRSHVPKAFCAGADLKERLTLNETEVQVFVSRLRALMSKIENLPMPVISAIDGVALGGGLEMALASDIRVASENALLGLVETKLAILPGAGGTQRLPRIVGPSLAKELIFTSRILSGQEAKELGIVNHCVKTNNENDSAFLKSLEIAREIIPNGPVGIKMAKVAINRGIEVDINSGCTIEELCYAQVIPTEDRVEGLKAFREKRVPVYKGV